MLTRQNLMRIKVRALRRRVWFHVTSRLERGIVDLTIHCVKRIRSSVLAEIISEIVAKTLMAMENSFVNRAESIGAEIAKRICDFASAWGNGMASGWEHDRRFVRFLGINAINAHVSCT